MGIAREREAPSDIVDSDDVCVQRPGARRPPVSRCRDPFARGRGRPAELLPVANRPILVHVLERLRDAGVADVVVVTDRRSGEAIRDAVGDGSELGMEPLSPASSSSTGSGPGTRSTPPRRSSAAPP